MSGISELWFWDFLCTKKTTVLAIYPCDNLVNVRKMYLSKGKHYFSI